MKLRVLFFVAGIFFSLVLPAQQLVPLKTVKKMSGKNEQRQQVIVDSLRAAGPLPLVITGVGNKHATWMHWLDLGADSLVVPQIDDYKRFLRIYRIHKEQKGGCHCIRL